MIHGAMYGKTLKLWYEPAPRCTGRDLSRGLGVETTNQGTIEYCRDLSLVIRITAIKPTVKLLVD